MSGRHNTDNFSEGLVKLAGGMLLVIAVMTIGCAAPRPDYSVRSTDPTVLIPAIRIAVANKDMSALPMLVKDLDSDDPAIRFYANDGLAKLTGQNFGYQYYADEPTREPAVKRWKAWLAGPTTHSSHSSNGDE